MSEIPAMAHEPSDAIKTQHIPAAEPMNTMLSYQPVPTPNPIEANASSPDPTTAAKTPSLQSNMFKMQRNKSKSSCNQKPFNLDFSQNVFM